MEESLSKYTDDQLRDELKRRSPEKIKSELFNRDNTVKEGYTVSPKDCKHEDVYKVAFGGGWCRTCGIEWY